MPTDDQNAELLLARWNATLPRQQELGENLITRYSEQHRRYHTDSRPNSGQRPDKGGPDAH